MRLRYETNSKSVKVFVSHWSCRSEQIVRAGRTCVHPKSRALQLWYPSSCTCDSNFGTLLGHHLRKMSGKQGTGAVHEKNTKVCRNLVPKWEASGRDNEILGTILGAWRVGKGGQNRFLGDHLGKRREKGGTEAVHEKSTKVCRNLVPKWEASALKKDKDPNKKV